MDVSGFRLRHQRSRLAVFARLAAAGVLGLPMAAHAEFLFAPSDPTPNGFFTPTIDFIPGEYEYSAWDIFYSAKNAPNYPDIFAPAGGVYDPATQTWKPELRSSAGFPSDPNYNPADAYAFWDTYNPTITQVKSNSTFVIGPDASGNIYTYQDKTGYQLHQAADYAQLGTVIFQFQTDGTTVDFSKIRLGYKGADGNTHYLGISDPETEYLREYSTTGSSHWSAAAGYRNRVLLQWDLSGVTSTGEFWIEWESLSSSMSFQKADLVTASYNQVGMPASSTWIGGNGVWSDSANWQGQAGGTPLENGNLKFKNTAAVALDIDDTDHLAGEIIFENAADVVIHSSGNHRLTANTGITTRSTAPDAASRVYTVNTDYQLGALNFFEINTGTVVMNGEISGNYGLVKQGAGTVVMNGNNTFGGFLGVEAGTLRITGTNAYSGTTSVLNGRLIAANSGAFGTGTSALNIGGDADLYAFTTGASGWLAELLIEGDLTINRDIALAAGDLGKRLGAFGTTSGAQFSGNISFSGVVANPDAPGGSSAVGNTRLTAPAATDRLVFSGLMTGGSASKIVTIDGAGTVLYVGPTKTYNTSTIVQSGTLEIAAGSGYTGEGNLSVSLSGTLRVDGALGGNGALAVNGTLTGSGTVGRPFTIANGAVLSPGDSAGQLTTAAETWAGGGTLRWEMNDATAVPGTGWDFLDIQGALAITATPINLFTVDLVSLTLGNEAGAAFHFDPQADHSWLLATATGGITGFSAGAFQLDRSEFLGATGTWEISQNGNSLYISYLVVPEPSAGMLFGLASVLASGFARWRSSHPLPRLSSSTPSPGTFPRAVSSGLTTPIS